MGSRAPDPIVLAKARAAAIWCQRASTHEKAAQGKPWGYLLIPHDVIADDTTIDGLARTYRFAAPEEDR